MTRQLQLQLQQGDVLIQQVDSIPIDAERVPSVEGKYIIMKGEVTGHCHAIAEKGATVFMHKGDLYIDVAEPTTIYHDEHKPIQIPVGRYQIGRVQEFDYFNFESRYVLD